MTRSVLAFSLLIVASTLALGQTRWFVDQSTTLPPAQQDGQEWDTAYDDLQDVLGNSNLQPGHEIWVARGVYKPYVQNLEPGDPGEQPDARAATYRIPAAVRVYGGFRGCENCWDENNPFLGEDTLSERNPEINLTILSGDIAGDDDDGDITDLDDLPDNFPNNGTYSDNVYHVVTMPNSLLLEGPTLLSGFIVQGGYSDNTLYGHSAGGGVKSILEDNPEPNPPIGDVQFNRLKVRYNYAFLGGGGMLIQRKDITFKFANCTFEHNYVLGGDGGGGLLSKAAVVDMVNCSFYDNHALAAYGGGAANQGPTALDPRPLAQRSIINSTFAGNSSASFTGGGGLFTDVQFSYYDEQQQEFVWIPAVRMANSIVWANEPPQNQLQQVDSLIVEYSDIQLPNPNDVWPGDGNLNVDPLFRDLSNGILRVRHCSPVIDQGFDPLITSDLTDVNNNFFVETQIPWDRDKGPRRLVVVTSTCDRIVDMGAWEECLRGDINGDGVVSLEHLTQLLSCFGTPD